MESFLDPAPGIWRPAPSLLSPRSALATAVLDGLYALGGAEANTGAASARVEQLGVEATEGAVDLDGTDILLEGKNSQHQIL